MASLRIVRKDPTPEYDPAAEFISEFGLMLGMAREQFHAMSVGRSEWSEARARVKALEDAAQLFHTCFFKLHEEGGRLS
jgi:hypothetical protein